MPTKKKLLIIIIITWWPTKAKEAPSPHEVRLTPLDTKPVFQCLRDDIFQCLKNDAFFFRKPVP